MFQFPLLKITLQALNWLLLLSTTLPLQKDCCDLSLWQLISFTRPHQHQIWAKCAKIWKGHKKTLMVLLLLYHTLNPPYTHGSQVGNFFCTAHRVKRLASSHWSRHKTPPELKKHWYLLQQAWCSVLMPFFTYSTSRMKAPMLIAVFNIFVFHQSQRLSDSAQNKHNTADSSQNLQKHEVF